MSKDYLRYRRHVSAAEKQVDELIKSGPENYVQSRLQAYGNQAAQDQIRTPRTHRTVLDQPRRDDPVGYGKKVALTFDDGPDVSVTPRILDTLKEHGIEVTFFIHGERVNTDEARALLTRMRDEGHIIANHTERHVASVSDRRREGVNFDRTQERIAPFQDPTHPTFTRMPGGAGDETTIRTLEEKDHAFVHWDADTMDYCYNEFGREGECNHRYMSEGNERDMLGHTLGQLGRFNGGIILAHDGANRNGISREFTAENLDELIQRLQEEDYSFTNLDDEQTFPELNRYARALNPAPYARNDLMDELKEQVDVQVEEFEQLGQELRDTLPDSVSWFSRAGDEVDAAKSTWNVNTVMSDLVQGFSIDYHMALMYGIHAKQAFEAFRLGIEAQRAADVALGR